MRRALLADARLTARALCLGVKVVYFVAGFFLLASCFLEVDLVVLNSLLLARHDFFVIVVKVFIAKVSKLLLCFLFFIGIVFLLLLVIIFYHTIGVVNAKVCEHLELLNEDEGSFE